VDESPGFGVFNQIQPYTILDATTREASFLLDGDLSV
jgi:hypothetical protein